MEPWLRMTREAPTCPVATCPVSGSNLWRNAMVPWSPGWQSPIKRVQLEHIKSNDPLVWQWHTNQTFGLSNTVLLKFLCRLLINFGWRSVRLLHIYELPFSGFDIKNVYDNKRKYDPCQCSILAVDPCHWRTFLFLTILCTKEKHSLSWRGMDTAFPNSPCEKKLRNSLSLRFSPHHSTDACHPVHQSKPRWVGWNMSGAWCVGGKAISYFHLTWVVCEIGVHPTPLYVFFGCMQWNICTPSPRIKGKNFLSSLSGAPSFILFLTLPLESTVLGKRT